MVCLLPNASFPAMLYYLSERKNMHKVRQLTKKMMRCTTEINVEVTKEDEICETGDVQVFQTCTQSIHEFRG